MVKTEKPLTRISPIRANSRNSRKPTPFNTAIAGVLKEKMTQARAFVTTGNDDDRLIKLSRRLNEISDDVVVLPWLNNLEREKGVNNLRFNLSSLAAFTLLWLTSGERMLTKGIAAIRKERGRQKELFLAGKLPFDCASPIADNRRKFRVLFEECGEVAHAIDQIENHGLAAGNLKRELTQVAAVAVAWLEALENSNPANHADDANGK